MDKHQLAMSWGNRLVTELYSTHDIPVALPFKVTCSPRLMIFSTRLQDSRKLKKLVGLGEPLALAMGAYSCRIYRHYGEVVIEAPLPESMWVTVRPRHIKLKGGFWLTLGISSVGGQVCCRLTSDRIAPVLVAGRSGCGKTELVRLMLWQLLQQNTPETMRFVLYDPKMSLACYHNSENLAVPPLLQPADAIAGVTWLMEQLTQRMRTRQKSPRLVVVIDELVEFMGVDEAAMGKALGRIASLGRELGIHVIMATQRPDRKRLDALVGGNVGFRLVGKTADQVEANVASGMGGTMAHTLSGRGDFLGILCDNAVRFTGALVEEAEIKKLPMVDAPPQIPTGTSLAQLLAATEGEEVTLGHSPDHVAAAMIMGIGKLKRRLKMGQDNATQLRRYGTDVVEELTKLGWELRKARRVS